ncbi:hypothetical protein Lalb_Chr14g0363441 [Lupinus albus]|uniref:Bacterial Ig-like domain-containing protein n=1 Tax=Lupinus albus TaxID=3870 RepID=A0A6A4PD85_LUPAL|nr:hypothetical protein Lalb_Chr14g0363441 [Lupinus albus]
MVTLKFLQLCSIVALMVFGVCLIRVESTLMVNFISVPPSQSKSSNAVFQFHVERLDGSNACKRSNCSFSCQLDGKVYPCGANGIVLRNLTQNQEHNFILNVTTNKGERNSSLYSWFIDTTAPTAAITSEQMYTNAKRVTIDITFSEPCTGLGGFKCLNSSICDVMVAGPAKVHASSLLITTPGVKYSLEVILSSEIIRGRAVIALGDNTCSDQAGNKFIRTNDSTLIIHFDRRPVMVDFWTSVPSYVMKINSIPRTVVATSKPEELIIFLDFSIPLRNSTEQILNALYVNSGALTHYHRRSNETRRFAFKLENISRTEIITVKLQATSILGKTGTHVSPVDPITFLYDLTKPRVVLKTSSPNETRDANIHIIAEFTKPVFGFEASMVVVLGGRLIRFKELSRALYSLTIQALSQKVVSVTIPSGKVTDISGNENLASNQLDIKHYSTPAISIALYSFVSAGTIATSLITAMVCLSSANLEAISMLDMGGTTSHAYNPSMNLNGMVGHLQVFALTSWFSTNQPIKYSETTRGLWWLIPHHKLPWEDYDHSSKTLENEKLTTSTNRSSIRENSYIRDRQHIGIMSSSYIEHKVTFPTEITSKYGWFHNQQSMKNVFYGLPLSSIEYFTYFLRGEPISASNVIKALENNKGWKDMEMNLFWLGIGGGFFILVHVFMILFLRWRTRKPPQGTLSMPRFEFFLLILILPCLSQSSTFVIKGGTTRGIITGVLLLAIPAAFILSLFLFLTIAISSGSFAQYKEFNQVTNEAWCMKLWFFLVGRPTTGNWFYKERLPSSFLSRFGILFDNWKGSPVHVSCDQNEPNTITKWTESGQSGIGRMKAINLEDNNEVNKIPRLKRVFGCMRVLYINLDLIRRVSLGIISVAFSSEKSSKSIFALIITLTQFIYLFTIKPYISRGVQVVESVSLLCEAGVFGIFVIRSGLNFVESKTCESVMLVLLLLTFIAQLINQWYAIVQSLVKLSQPQNNSLWQGLKFAFKGLILPFLPTKHWSNVISTFSQLKTYLLSVNPMCSGTEFDRRNRAGYMGPISTMSATVVPVLSPGTPSRNVVERKDPITSETPANVNIEVEGKWLKGEKSGLKNELKILRELAKASFSRDATVGEASTSYTEKPLSDEVFWGNPNRRY